MFRQSLKIGFTLFQSTTPARKFSTTNLEILRAILLRGGSKQQQLKEMSNIDHEFGNTTTAIMQSQNNNLMLLNYRGNLKDKSFETIETLAKKNDVLELRSFQKDCFVVDEPIKSPLLCKRK